MKKYCEAKYTEAKSWCSYLNIIFIEETPENIYATGTMISRLKNKDTLQLQRDQSVA